VSPTQPGRGIRKIVDLYHDLHELVDKATSHASKDLDRLNSEETDEYNDDEFAGLTEEEIKEEQRK
jgi:hypothetical protein